MSLISILAFMLVPTAMGTSSSGYDYSNPDVEWCTVNGDQTDCCGTLRQSPIDINTTALVKQTNDDDFPNYVCPLGWSGDYFQAQTGKWFNTGHTHCRYKTQEGRARKKRPKNEVEFEPWTSDLILTGGPLGDKKYKLIQFHFHWGSDPCQGSEHTLNGVKYSAEVHLVHQNINNSSDLAVVGFFLDVLSSTGKSTWLDSLVDDAFNIRTKERSVCVNHIIGQLFVEAPSLTNYAYYLGSLTTPGCSEIVNWIVMLDPVPIRDSQLNFFRKTIGDGGINNSDNNRPVQDLNGRTVYKSLEIH